MSDARKPELDKPRDEESVRLSKRFLILALIGLFVASLILLGLLKAFGTLQPGSPSMEVFKAVLQLGVISVAAAAVAMLSFNYQFERQREESARQQARQQEETDRQQERRDQEKARETEQQQILRKIELLRRTLEYRDDLLRTILGRAVTSYSAVKKARRLLRALGTREKTKKVILVEAYDKQMDAVNDAQLVFENLQRDVANSVDAFSKPGWIVENLKSMDSYLGKLVSEYEKKRPALSDRLPISKLEDLSDFISFSDESRFQKEIVQSFYEVQKAIREDLITPQFIDLESLVDTPAKQ